MSTNGNTVLVLGGGVGGVVAARTLRKRLPARDRVVLIDREPNHLFQSSLLWVLTGTRRLAQIQRPLAKLGTRGVDVVQGPIEEIDPDRLGVRVNGKVMRGDAMIIALGAELDEHAVPGLAEAGHNLYSERGAAGFNAELGGIDGGRIAIVTAAPGYKCPAAPYEAAMLIRDWLLRNGRTASVHLHAAEPGPMPTAGPAVSQAVRDMIESRGIDYTPAHRIESADPEHRTLRFTDGTTAAYDVLLYVPPHRAADVVRSTALTDDAGWIAVDRHSMRTAAAGVYAVGDVTNIPIGGGRALPKSGVFAHRQAHVVASNVAAELDGRKADDGFDGTGACFIETGSGRAAYGAGDFYAEGGPVMKLRPPSRTLHVGKVLFEKYWFMRWFGR